MGELVSFLCVRADHQWGSQEQGRIQATQGALGWCPDATSGVGEAHDWRPCDRVSLASAASLAALYTTVESAVS